MSELEGFLKQVTSTKDEFLRRIQHESGRSVLIIAHHDADGLCAASILALALKREKIPFQIRIIKQLTDRSIKELAEEIKFPIFAFVDFGCGQLSIILEYCSKDNLLLLDHHEFDDLVSEQEMEGLLQVNPWKLGIDGSINISAAGVAFFFAIAINKENRDLAYLSIIGAVGDKQDKAEKSSLQGINQEIVRTAIECGIISQDIDLKVFGRFSRPVHLALSNTMNPYIPGLSGNDSECIACLNKLNIPLREGKKQRTISNLSQDEKSRLVSGIIEWSLKHGMNPEKVRNIIGTVYILENEDPKTNLKDLREFASLINACGRSGYAGVALGIAMGNRQELLKKGQIISNEYRDKLINYIDWVSVNNTIKSRENMVIIEGGSYIDDSMIGPLISTLMDSRKIGKELPIIGWARLKENEKIVKISARADPNLLRKNLNLGKSFITVMKKLYLEEISR
jgi:RecJ-like exonuclease